jgi:hypothetical protein
MIHRVLFLSIFLGGLVIACGTDGVIHPEDSASPCGLDYDAPIMPERNDDRVTISQGVWGDVWYWEGNFMPVCPTGTVQAVVREMRIHALASSSDVEHTEHGAFYSKVNTPLIATVWSGSNGFFQATLPAGTYSVFAVEQDSLLYANGFDGEGHIYPVEVKDGKAAGIRFDITYRMAQ